MTEIKYRRMEIGLKRGHFATVIGRWRIMGMRDAQASVWLWGAKERCGKPVSRRIVIFPALVPGLFGVPAALMVPLPSLSKTRRPDGIEELSGRAG